MAVPSVPTVPPDLLRVVRRRDVRWVHLRRVHHRRDALRWVRPLRVVRRKAVRWDPRPRVVRRKPDLRARLLRAAPPVPLLRVVRRKADLPARRLEIAPQALRQTNRPSASRQQQRPPVPTRAPARR